MINANSRFVWLESEYLNRADETVQTCILDGKRVIYVHFENGYHSLVEGVKNLQNFLNGDTSERFACVESEEEVEKVLNEL